MVSSVAPSLLLHCPFASVQCIERALASFSMLFQYAFIYERP